MAQLLVGRRRMNTKDQKHFSIIGFSPLRVAYTLSIVIIALISTDFLDACYRFGSQIWDGALVLFVLVIFLCILAPRNAPHRFLPVVLAFLGLIALILCEPI